MLHRTLEIGMDDMAFLGGQESIHRPTDNPILSPKNKLGLLFGVPVILPNILQMALTNHGALNQEFLKPSQLRALGTN